MKKIIGIFIVMLLIATAIPVAGNYNFHNIDFEENDRICSQNENFGFMFAIGDFTEHETAYVGNYSYYLFIGIVFGEFHFYQGQDEYLILHKDAIVKAYIITSTIIFARILVLF